MVGQRRKRVPAMGALKTRLGGLTVRRLRGDAGQRSALPGSIINGRIGSVRSVVRFADDTEVVPPLEAGRATGRKAERR